MRNIFLTLLALFAFTNVAAQEGGGVYTDGASAGIAIAGAAAPISIPGGIITLDLAAVSSAVVDNGDGTITHTAADGTATTFTVGDTIVNNGDGTFTVTPADGSAAYDVDTSGGLSPVGTSVTTNADGSLACPDGQGLVFGGTASTGVWECVPLPVVDAANALPCQLVGGAVLSGAQLETWLDKGVEFNDGAINNHSTPCDRFSAAVNDVTTNGPFSSNVSTSLSITRGDYSINRASNDSTANGNYTANVAARSSISSAASTFSANIGGIGLVNEGIYSLLTGRDNWNRGGYNTIVNRGNEIIATAGQRNFLSGAANEIIGDGAAADANAILAGVLNKVGDGSTGIQNTVILAGRRTIAPNSDTIVGGYAAGGVSLSSNRTFEGTLNGGNLDISGAFTAGVAFPDVGEMFTNSVPGVIPLGTAVTIGENGVKIANENDAVIGVVSHGYGLLMGNGAANGVDRYVYGDFGERLKGNYIEYDVVFDENSDVIYSEDGKGNVSYKDGVKPELKNVGRTVYGYLTNPDWDGSKAGLTKLEVPNLYTAVGLIGQPIARVGKGVVSGDYLKSAAGGVLVKSEYATNIMALKPYKDTGNFQVVLGLSGGTSDVKEAANDNEEVIVKKATASPVDENPGGFFARLFR